ncbi:hypothetical protein ACIRPH_31155 [Nocardiopsis sp. NPDC101807]|uniref:hypothetical protein n=1 Tax=Nocardiopsis sp. NPDC101807 TaxID=3364339 RepID=UPI00380379A9
MPRGHPVDPATRARIKDLHGQDLARNAIARELGISGYTVTKVCKEEGLSFDREATKAATEAKVVDNRARRQAAIARFYDQTDKVFDRLDRTSHQLKEVSAGKLVEYESEDLPAQDLRALIQAANAAITSAVKLEQVDVDDRDLPTVDAWLKTMLGEQ